MADPINYLIGRGETLVRPISIATGGGDKAHPYTFEEAFRYLAPEIERTAAAIENLDPMACPEDEAVISVTLHPSYLAKSYHPTRLLKGLGLRQVGSREQRVQPRKSTRKDPSTQPLVAPELFVAGNRRQLTQIASLVRSANESVQDEFRRIEHIRPLSDDRLVTVPGRDPAPPLEVVLHADPAEHRGEAVLVAFQEWCRRFDIDPHFERMQQIGGLAFFGFHAPRHALEEFAQFAFLRKARRMPRLTMRSSRATVN